MSINYIQSTTQVCAIDYAYIPDSIITAPKSLGVLGLINPTSSTITVNTSTAALGYINSISELATSSFSNDYIPFMKYSFYSIEPKIKALGFEVNYLHQLTGNTTTCNYTLLPSWDQLSTSSSYITVYSNINKTLTTTSTGLLTANTATFGLFASITPCFILENHKKLLWHYNGSVSGAWQGVLQYFNFTTNITKTIIAHGGTTTNNLYWCDNYFSASTTASYQGQKTIYDNFTKDCSYHEYFFALMGTSQGNFSFKVSDCKIGNPQRALPVVFINNIPGTTSDNSFKIDGVYKYWYAENMTWQSFINDIKKYNLGNQVRKPDSHDLRVNFYDASLREYSASGYQLYVKNSNTCIPVQSTDLIDGSLYYTTYSS